MPSQTEKGNTLIKIIGWTAVNMLAMFFMGSLLLLSTAPAVLNNKTIYQIVDILNGISVLGGGVLIAICQWLFLRHLHPKINGGGWIWIISGVVSSIAVFTVVALSILGLGDYPTDKDNLFIIFLVISEQIICLSLIQGLFLYANKYKKALQWVVINIFGYGLVVILSAGLIYGSGYNFAILIVSLTLITIFITGVSGWGLSHVLESRDNDKIDNVIREVNPQTRNVYFFQANLENQNLSGQNFDGADFRKANLRRTILDNVSCLPAMKTQTSTSGLIFRILGFISALDGQFADNSGIPVRKTVRVPANFSGADLTGASLKGAKLIEADFSSAVLTGADLNGASLSNANMMDANLTNANLTDTDMRDAFLCRANLEGADLTGAKLEGVDFENANLKNAILYGVDLRETKYLSSANLEGADLRGAIMPEKNAL